MNQWHIRCCALLKMMPTKNVFYLAVNCKKDIIFRGDLFSFSTLLISLGLYLKSQLHMNVLWWRHSCTFYCSLKVKFSPWFSQRKNKKHHKRCSCDVIKGRLYMVVLFFVSHNDNLFFSYTSDLHKTASLCQSGSDDSPQPRPSFPSSHCYRNQSNLASKVTPFRYVF